MLQQAAALIGSSRAAAWQGPVLLGPLASSGPQAVACFACLFPTGLAAAAINSVIRMPAHAQKNDIIATASHNDDA